MSNLKTIIPVVIMALLIGASTSYSMTFKKAEPVKKSEKIKSHKDRSVTSTHKARVKKISGILKKIEGNVLYLNNNTKHNLRGVKVIDFTKKAGSTLKKRKMVEMTFINGKLKEIIIR